MAALTGTRVLGIRALLRSVRASVNEGGIDTVDIYIQLGVYICLFVGIRALLRLQLPVGIRALLRSAHAQHRHCSNSSSAQVRASTELRFI